MLCFLHRLIGLVDNRQGIRYLYDTKTCITKSCILHRLSHITISTLHISFFIKQNSQTTQGYIFFHIILQVCYSRNNQILLFFIYLINLAINIRNGKSHISHITIFVGQILVRIKKTMQRISVFILTAKKLCLIPIRLLILHVFQRIPKHNPSPLILRTLISRNGSFTKTFVKISIQTKIILTHIDRHRFMFQPRQDLIRLHIIARLIKNISNIQF